MRYDLWRVERNRAEVVEPYGVRVLRQDSARNDGSVPTVKIWRPKAIKPDAFVRFSTPERREDYITRWLEGFNRGEEMKAERRTERKSVAAGAPRVTVGTIFCHSWGWDQTNVDYYEVVRASGSTVEVKPIGSEEVPGSQGAMSAQVRPVPGAFIDKTYRLQDAHGNYRTSLRKRVQYTDKGEPFLSFEYGWCGVTTPDQSRYSSWYA